MSFARSRPVIELLVRSYCDECLRLVSLPDFLFTEQPLVELKIVLSVSNYIQLFITEDSFF